MMRSQYIVLLILLGLSLLCFQPAQSNGAHGDEYGFREYLRDVGNKRNKKEIYAEGTNTKDAAAFADALRSIVRNGRRLEQRNLGDWKWLEQSCEDGCWWCCYIWKVISKTKQPQVFEAYNLPKSNPSSTA